MHCEAYGTWDTVKAWEGSFGSSVSLDTVRHCNGSPGFEPWLRGDRQTIRIKKENMLHLCLHERRVWNVSFALYTGLAYRDDPTILAWETGNELYYPSLDWTLRLGTDRRKPVINPTNGILSRYCKYLQNILLNCNFLIVVYHNLSLPWRIVFSLLIYIYVVCVSR